MSGIKNMLKFVLLQKKIYKFLHFLIGILQILLFLTIFSVTLYWFVDCLNSHVLDFLKPLADFIQGFVKLFYKQMIEVNGVEVDGSILLFDIIALFTIIIAAQLSTFLKKQISKIDIIKEKLADEEEDAFNKELRQDYEKSVLKNHNIGILISYNLKKMTGNSYFSEQDDVFSTDSEIDKKIYFVLSKISGCKISKTDRQFFLQHDNFEKIDFLLNYINAMFTKIDDLVLQKSILLTTYIAIMAYDDNIDIKNHFILLNKMLALKIPNEMICSGDFTLRYELLKDKKFTTRILADYYIPPNIKIWAIVKKH